MTATATTSSACSTTDEPSCKMSATACTDDSANKDVQPGDYTFTLPDTSAGPFTHFSSVLRSADWLNTFVEVGLIAGLAYAGIYHAAAVDMHGSMPLKEVATLLACAMCVARVYNAYLEACYFSFPQYRIQPPREHALGKSAKDLCGRDLKQLEVMVVHDRLTLISQFALNVALYCLLPGYYPAAPADPAELQPLYIRVARIALNHYVMSFGMYWMHRAYHVVPWLWKHIHSLHHWARHPLSRNTYQDHWADNFGNAIVGHCFAQILVPLDNGCFWFSHIFRIFESLEKHSGISCNLNLAHAMQRWLPFAQMPHHHDWHHEGHKSCNFTFCSLGGVWDCVFGTRKAGGRAANCLQATRRDHAEINEKLNKAVRGRTMWDNPWCSLLPVAFITVLVAMKLRSHGLDSCCKVTSYGTEAVQGVIGWVV